MSLSKRAKARLKMASASDRKKVAAAAKVLFDNELMGVKRANEIQRLYVRLGKVNLVCHAVKVGRCYD